jgi:hypothetical protein
VELLLCCPAIAEEATVAVAGAEKPSMIFFIYFFRMVT